MKKSQYELDIALDDAINRAALDEVKKLIELGASINGRDPLNWTPLMNAAWVGADDIVELLLSKGVDINAVNNEDKTALDMVLEAPVDSEFHNRVIEILGAITR